MEQPMAGAAQRKEETHERIVRAAARAIRRHGYNGIGVADLMREAGLTHGGFYAHFASKDALLAEAADRAGGEAVESLAKAVAGAPPEAALEALIRAYLSDAHTGAVEQGCAVAALGGETPRQAPEVRRAGTRRIKDMIGLVERQMPGWGQAGNHEAAIAILAGLVGALVLARAVDEPTLSRAIRDAATDFLLRAGVPPSP
jgi:TetR/AcrR family transcriptional regulator, transcriptional repressor for nem operon